MTKEGYSGKRLSEIQTKRCLAWFIARDTVPHTTARRYSGGIRGENQLEILETLDNWVSHRLGICFQLGEPEMLLFYPDGQAFTSYNQEKQRAERLANKLRELGINPHDI